MIKAYKITYKAVKNCRTMIMTGFSKEDVMRRFVSSYPGKSVVSIEEVEI